MPHATEPTPTQRRTAWLIRDGFELTIVTYVPRDPGFADTSSASR